MDFNHTDERRMLAETIQRYASNSYPLEVRLKAANGSEGYSAEHWRRLSELGVTGVLLPADAGGLGGDGFDIMAVFEALGRSLVREPFLTALMAGTMIAALSPRHPLLTAMVDGASLVALAHGEAHARYDLAHVETGAARADGGWRLTGGKCLVADAETADVFLVSARTSGAAGEPAGISMFLVPADARRLRTRGYATIDGGRAGDLELDGVIVPEAARLGPEGGAFETIERAIAAGTLALSAEALGAMESVKELTLDYLRSRVQFGAPIGSFQVLQHRMAAIVIEIEQARSAVINAAAVLGAGRDRRERAVSAAKYTIGRVGTLAAEEAIQMHGGMGMTQEMAVSHFAKRLIMIDHALGDIDHHLERYASIG